MEYLLKVSAVIAIFYLCYKLFLQRDTFFEANRWFLMLGLFTSFVLPFIVIPIYTEYTPVAVPGFPINEITPSAPTEKPFNPLDYLPLIYGLGVAFFTIWFLVQLTSLTKLILQNKGRKEGYFTFIETNGETPPFSFFNWIVYNPNQFNQQELAQIIAHEKAHAKQIHSIDILLAQIGCVLLWFNPFMWLYNKDLKQNLEFIADNAAIKENHCKKSYQYTLLKTSMPSHQMALGNAFYNSLIKKRIVMLHKSKSKKVNQLKYVLVIPIVALFLMGFNTEEVFIQKPNDTALTPYNAKDVTIVFNKNLSNNDLINIQRKLKKDSIDFTYTSLKRNEKEEIITLIAKFKNDKGGSVTCNAYNNNSDPIKSFIFYIRGDEMGVKANENKNENQISPWKVSSERNNTVFATADTLYVNENPNEIEKLLARFDETPLYLIDGKEVSEKEIRQVNPLLVESALTTQGGENTIKEYGNKAKNGVLHIKLRNKPIKNQTVKLKNDALYIVNGKEISYDEFNRLNPETIKSIRPLNDENQIKKYGDKGKNGVFLIETKSNWETNFKVRKTFNSEELMVSGTVTNDKGTAIPGVTVLVKDKNSGALTDANGNYKIMANKGDNLIFSYTGMVSQIIKIENANDIDIKLSSELFSNLKSTEKNQITKPQNAWTTGIRVNTTQTQGEPLFIVNGEEVSGDIVGALNPDAIESIEVLKEEKHIKKYGNKGKNGVMLITTKPNTKLVLEGKPANNIKVTGYGAKPDSISNIRIRATSTANGGYPLFIVDGKEMSQKEFSKLTADDIESLNILKDESTIKQYGDKAKYGVVIITTKK